MKIKICRISPEEAINVRHPVLRSGQGRESAMLQNDHNRQTVHFGVFHENILIACSTIFPDGEKVDDNNWRLRGMATLPEFQNNGIGTKLLQKCESFIKSQKGVLIWCNARFTAAGFYQNNGFKISGKQFDIPQIGPHFKMEKKL